MTTETDALRGRSDFGTGEQAIRWLVEVYQDHEHDTFLKAWTHGDLGEWPEYIEWLDAQPAALAQPAPAVGLNEYLAAHGAVPFDASGIIAAGEKVVADMIAEAQPAPVDAEARAQEVLSAELKARGYPITAVNVIDPESRRGDDPFYHAVIRAMLALASEREAAAVRAERLRVAMWLDAFVDCGCLDGRLSLFAQTLRAPDLVTETPPILPKEP